MNFSLLFFFFLIDLVELNSTIYDSVRDFTEADPDYRNNFLSPGESTEENSPWVYLTSGSVTNTTRRSKVLSFTDFLFLSDKLFSLHTWDLNVT